MKALLRKTAGLDNLEVAEVERSKIGEHEVLLKVKMAGVNPVDYRVANNENVNPLPHIPGAEIAGEVEETGDHSTRFKKGDRVMVYNRMFCGVCDMCLSSREMICRHGGVRGIATNGGFSEYYAVPEKNLFPIPDSCSWELAASLPVSALTPYHALRMAALQEGETLAVFGASGNTGQFACQLGKLMGAEVIAISRKKWLTEFGAKGVLDMGSALSSLTNLTHGAMCDVVFDPLGQKTWATSFSALGIGARWVTSGVLTGPEVQLSLASIHSRHITIIGSTGGSRCDLQRLIEMSGSLNVRIWKKFSLDQGKQAIQLIFSPERNGRILIEFD